MYLRGVQKNWIFYFMIFFVIFQRFSQNKKIKKIEKLLPPHPQTTQGGYLNGFVSLGRLDGRFCSLERKSKFGSKLKETKITFSLTIEWGESSSSAHARRQPDCHRFNSQQGHQKHICTAPHTYRHNSFARSVGLHAAGWADQPSRSAAWFPQA